MLIVRHQWCYKIGLIMVRILPWKAAAFVGSNQWGSSLFFEARAVVYTKACVIVRFETILNLTGMKMQLLGRDVEFLKWLAANTVHKMFLLITILVFCFVLFCLGFFLSLIDSFSFLPKNIYMALNWRSMPHRKHFLWCKAINCI